jgi:His/Glu/Gln/Arg/opine family amino acid ABC transporter permease subunit
VRRLATVVGLLAGIARVSNNWLLRQLAGVYVDLFRSTPLLVQLLFWYVGVIRRPAQHSRCCRVWATWAI